MKTMLLMLVVTGLTGCASTYTQEEKEYFIANHCDYDSGYADGTNDLQNDMPMNNGRFNICPEEKRAEARKGYREGYTQSYQTQVNYCNYDSGYELGTSDERKGREMATRDFNMCPEEKRAVAKKGYHDGYSQSKRARSNETLIDGIGGVIKNILWD